MLHITSHSTWSWIWSLYERWITMQQRPPKPIPIRRISRNIIHCMKFFFSVCCPQYASIVILDKIAELINVILSDHNSATFHIRADFLYIHNKELILRSKIVWKYCSGFSIEYALTKIGDMSSWFTDISEYQADLQDLFLTSHPDKARSMSTVMPNPKILLTSHWPNVHQALK